MALSMPSHQVGRQAVRLTQAQAPTRPVRRTQVCRSVHNGDVNGSKLEKSLWGENFGARDMTAGEKETNFATTGITNWDTDHITKPPDAMKRVLGLSSRSCKDNVRALKLLPAKQIELLRNQTAGWRMTATTDGKQALRCDWKAKDAATAPALAAKFAGVAETEGHHDSVKITVVDADVAVEISTASLGGLTENDFIIASKLNDLPVKELLPQPRKKFNWA